MKIGDSAAARVATVAGIAIFAVWAFGTWEESDPPDAPLHVVTSLEGVELGQRLANVPQKLGPFDQQKPQPHVVKKHKDEVDYQQRNGTLRLSVRNGVVGTISYACKQGRDGAAVNNVACYAFEDRIRKVFGDRVRVLCARVKPGDPQKDIAPHARAYDAVEYGTRYIVIKDVVQGFMVMDAKELESLVGLNWVKCG